MTSQVTHYQFRANAGGDEDLTQEEIADWCRAYCKTWGFQKEKSDTGYIHWQGHCALVKKRRKDEVMNRCWDLKKNFFNYFEPTANETIKADIAKYYSTKADTRLEGPWTSQDTEAEDDYVPRQFRGLTPRPYQQEVIDSCKEFNPRVVDYLFDPLGNLGKTCTVEMAQHQGLKVFEIENVYSMKDVKRETFDLLYARKERHPDVFFIDLPRALKQELLTDVFAAIEKIKDGKAKTDRYNSGTLWKFDSPRVWVFANMLPASLNGLSKDRWNFWAVQDGHLVQRSFTEILAAIRIVKYAEHDAKKAEAKKAEASTGSS